MEYFFYCRAKPGVEERWAELTEAHWSFMDGYAQTMVARGPTLSPDRATATGSMHIVDLPDSAAASVFAFAEPCYLGGIYDEVMVRRWHNELGRTMWEFEGEDASNRGFLVIGHAKPGVGPLESTLRAAQRLYFSNDGYDDHLIVRGSLLSDDGRTWLGDATLIELPDHSAVEEMLASAPLVRADLYGDVEVHAWEPGGRR